ncbi:MAG: YqiA/YcfP family alpha/beta fold hydrolase [Spongiibacteraceae bacterium]
MPAALIYLHGFLSSPESIKARQTQQYLAKHHPEVICHVPGLANNPGEALARADNLLRECLQSGCAPIGLVGSSLGGFMATVLAERYGLSAALVNPAVSPHLLVAHFLGEHINPYTGVAFHIDNSDVADLQAMIPDEIAPERYRVLLQTADETLDYRLAEQYYAGSNMTIEEGGDHSFQGFDAYLADIVEFLGLLG